MSLRWRFVAIAVLTTLAITLAAGVSRCGPSAKRASAVDFNRDIRPILSDNCFQCHGPDEQKRKAKLRLDNSAGALARLRRGGHAIVAGKPAASQLVARILAEDESERMPPPRTNKKLTPAQIDLLKRWIEEGASYAEHWAFVTPKRPPLPSVGKAAPGWPRNGIDHFILARLEREGLRPAPQADPVTLLRRVTLDLTGLPPTPQEVDAFLEGCGLRLDDAHDQSKITDQEPRIDRAYRAAVNRLLAAPHYGERMALDWLDAARFADTHGYHIDSGRDMTRWREWVIEAFNQNMPFDRFTVEQLAGDLLPAPASKEAALSQKIASGFNRNHMINFEGGAIPEEYHNAYVVDRVNTTGTVWLGLTLMCAQCHDHKYDPIAQKEFYQLYAFFYNVPENGLDGSKGNAAPMILAPTEQQQLRLDELAGRIKTLERALSEPHPELDAEQAKWERALRDREAEPHGKPAIPDNIAALLRAEKRTDAQGTELRDYYRKKVAASGPWIDLTRLQKEKADFEKTMRTAMVMQEGTPRETFVRVRGEYHKKGEKVQAGVPAFLPPLPQGAPVNRLGLARWLVAPEQPLTSRVIVNRYWQMFFGAGLVKSVEDFGSQSDPPSHPELLDWLAVEFQRPSASPQGSGAKQPWSVKEFVRLIVTSATYRQSSVLTKEHLARDADNRLYARGPRLRLQAEFIRDQALAVSGLLNRAIGGASVNPYQPEGLWKELSERADSKNWTAQFFVLSKGPDLYRRSMYTFWKRTSPPPQMLTFDAPDRETCTVRRGRTNTPLQALILMNDPTYVEASRKLAERLLREAKTTDERIALAFRLATARLPNERETAVLRGVYEKQQARYRADRDSAAKLLSVGQSPRDERLPVDELAAWSIVASVVLNLDETVTKN